jgi:hypothetical protein
MICASCKMTQYCSKACQASHWLIHKKYCSAFLRLAKNDARNKDSEAFLKLAENDLRFVSELRFKVGDKVKAHVGTEGEYVNGKIIKQWEEGEAYCIELEDEERSNVWARSDTNTYVMAGELRFKVGDKVQANVGEFVNGIVTRQWVDESVYRIQLEDGDRTICWAPQDADTYVRARK